MEKYVISGGRPLKGEVSISGFKNAAVAILPATVLANDVCVLENVPDISDIRAEIDILKELGAKVRRISSTVLEIDTSTINITEVPLELGQKMRASYYFLGSMLSRFGKASVPMPGGCNLGARPIDQHLKAFTALGAENSLDYAMVNVESDNLTGAHVFFDVNSVGATINAMLAAVMAEGTTILENVAKEPHIVDVANFLNVMGANVRGAGTDVIKIHGVKKMHGGTYSIVPDQIEAGTFMVAAAASHGDILIKNVIPKHLEPITSKLRIVGATVEEYDDSVRVIGIDGAYNTTNIKTMPHPGFPTDLQPVMGVLLCFAKGTSIITEGIWDNRFRYCDELNKMGANIQVEGRVAVFEGVEALRPAPVSATDLRAGAALVVAALCAEGQSEVYEIRHVERGYVDIVKKFQQLGGDIRKVVVPDEQEYQKAY
ncbi:MAG: UDP-N-acetylglucosamine 1-carboxyvinyltransferase [Oscillospiraceae bacterium]|nr:UDP-N-acetylglucosamine 1-carboxyvinyltransferase [Oscillospiraceae bacterium]MBQ5314005.1 UDP-N-acetylglucosamine 1-carboxyvinyltransferase [Oscillospiraceae bacterium]MBQ5323844.1 UDP-N-acetylglucosamine 1-carboxyvinyltransferase [Oscillospiraceae bacterium]